MTSSFDKADARQFCAACDDAVEKGPSPAAPTARRSIYVGPAYWMGRSLVVPPGGHVPVGACCICARAGTPPVREAKFRWFRKGLLGCALPLTLVGIMFGLHTFLNPSETATVPIPVCDRCWTRSGIAGWTFRIVLVLGFVPAAVGCSFLAAAHSGEGSIIWGLLGGMAGWIVLAFLVHRFLLSRFAIVCRKIDVRGVHLLPPRPKALRAAWGIQGEPPPPPPIRSPRRRPGR